jgi:hypothetical protein
MMVQEDSWRWQVFGPPKLVGPTVLSPVFMNADWCAPEDNLSLLVCRLLFIVSMSIDGLSAKLGCMRVGFPLNWAACVWALVGLSRQKPIAHSMQ